MGLVSYIQAALTLVLAVVTLLVLAAICAVRGDVGKLLGAFQKSHRYSDPSAAAVVTEASPSPQPVVAIEPVPVSSARSATAPTLVSVDMPEDDAPPDSEPRPISLQRLAVLTAEELADVDARAAKRGISREVMLELLVERGLFELERDPGPKTPPGSHANDDKPPPSET